jgi:thioredoxin-dependent peroxiredoxin
MDLEQITFRSSPVTLVSAPPRIGDIAPNFVATTAGGEPLQWADEHKGRVAIVGSLPSILLPECAAQIQVLDRNMPQFSGDDQIPLWLVTSDAPEDLARFIADYDITHVVLLSDVPRGEFGTRFGVRLKETDLLARTLFTIGKDQSIIYRELHREIIEDPQYRQAFKAAFSHLI